MDRNQINNELKYLGNKLEARGLKIFYPVFRNQHKAVAAFVRKYGIGAAKQALPLLIPVDDINKAMIRFYSEGGLLHAKWQYKKLYQGYKSLTGDIAKYVGSWLKELQMYVYYNLGDMISDINQNTLDVLRSEFDRYIQEGYSNSKAARLIEQELGGEFDKRRALMVARTEGTRAASKGHKLASDAWAKETGQQQYKEWISIMDNRTRFDHRITDGQTVPSDARFNVDGFLMDAPGDPTAPAKETVNCRCRAIYVSERMLNRTL